MPLSRLAVILVGFTTAWAAPAASLTDDHRVTMSLHEGGEDGPVVPCHFASPDAPTNPDLAPRDAWCLIPKRHPSAGTRCTVVAEIRDGGGREVWSFRTR